MPSYYPNELYQFTYSLAAWSAFLLILSIVKLKFLCYFGGIKWYLIIILFCNFLDFNEANIFIYSFAVCIFLLCEMPVHVSCQFWGRFMCLL